MPKLEYHAELDGLRAVAVLLVMASHSTMPIFVGGFVGVDLFFVLSGYLITALLVQEFEENAGRINFASFYMRRALRLFPALLLLLLLYLGVGLAFGQDREVHVLRALSALFYASNWTQAFGIQEMGPLSHTWSLAIEEQFYILWPWILYLALKHSRSRGRIAAFILAVAIGEWIFRVLLSELGVSVARIHVGFDTRADTLLIGCALAIVLSSPDLRARAEAGLRGKTEFLAAAGLISIAAWTMTSPEDTEGALRRYHFWGLFMAGIGTAFVILHVVLTRHGALNRVLASRPFVSAGKISYGLYLWHWPVFLVTFAGGARLVEYAPLENRIVMALVATAATFACATLSYRYVEAPALRMKGAFPAGGKRREIPPAARGDVP